MIRLCQSVDRTSNSGSEVMIKTSSLLSTNNYLIVKIVIITTRSELASLAHSLNHLIIYCVAGKFGRELNLVVRAYNRQFKSANISYTHDDTIPNRQI